MHLNKSSTKLRPDLLSKELSSFSFEAIGTAWSIKIGQSLSKVSEVALEEAIHDRINQFDKHYSRFRSDSLVALMSNRKGTYQLPDDAKPLFDLYQQLYTLSGGLLTPLVGQLLSDAGYDAIYSFRTTALKASLTWDEALEYNYPKLVVKQPVLIDVGAAGKGYLIDIISELILKAGITSYSINAGGDILNHRVSGESSKIGLEHPINLDEAIGIVTLHNGSICGSAGNKRAWGAYHHIINPVNKKSPDHIRATWVVASSTMLADGLATALFFTEPAQLAQAFDFEYAIIAKDLSLQLT
jgi:thiamine biosynthesis lipoprotein